MIEGLSLFTQISYLIAAALFVLSLKWLNAPSTARHGVIAGETGMLLAIVGTLVQPEIQHYQWIIVTVLAGTAIGVPIAYLMPMTAVPQRTALSHSFGGLAVGLVGAAEYYLHLCKNQLPPQALEALGKPSAGGKLVAPDWTIHPATRR